MKFLQVVGAVQRCYLSFNISLSPLSAHPMERDKKMVDVISKNVKYEMKCQWLGSLLQSQEMPFDWILPKKHFTLLTSNCEWFKMFSFVTECASDQTIIASISICVFKVEWSEFFCFLFFCFLWLPPKYAKRE